MTPGKANFTIYKGTDFIKVIRWETGPIIYKPITAVTSLAPLRLGVSTHEMPDGWRFAIQSVKGMTQLNAKKNPPVESDYYRGTVVDANTIEVNNINASDYSAYTSGGFIQYNTPMDLTLFTARMTVKDKIGGTSLLELSDTSGITISTANNSIEIHIPAGTSELFTFSKAVYDLEMVSSGGLVYRILGGSIKVVEEVTT